MAYKVKLQIFEGPLDLLLYLVKQNHLEIASIPIAEITEQYLTYIELMQALDLDIAGDFLVMAATLMQIKSRMLLPPETLTPLEEEEPDPRQQLIERLLEYQKFKEAAEMLSTLEKGRLTQFTRPVAVEGEAAAAGPREELVEASLFDLLTTFSQFMTEGIPRDLVHEIMRDEFTVEEKVKILRDVIEKEEKLSVSRLFGEAKNKLEVIATFLAILELIKQRTAVVRQSRVFGEIWILRNAEGSEVAG